MTTGSAIGFNRLSQIRKRGGRYAGAFLRARRHRAVLSVVGAVFVAVVGSAQASPARHQRRAGHASHPPPTATAADDANGRPGVASQRADRLRLDPVLIRSNQSEVSNPLHRLHQTQSCKPQGQDACTSPELVQDACGSRPREGQGTCGQVRAGWMSWADLRALPLDAGRSHMKALSPLRGERVGIGGDTAVQPPKRRRTSPPPGSFRTVCTPIPDPSPLNRGKGQDTTIRMRAH